VSELKGKTVFDEHTLAKLLEAAYVVQEHNRKLLALGLRVEHEQSHDVRPDDGQADAGRPAQTSAPPMENKRPETSQPAPAAKDEYTLSMMLEALEKLEPDLETLLGKSAAGPKTGMAAPKVAQSSATVLCHRCGRELLGEEQFCGSCGFPRSGDYAPVTIQSKPAPTRPVQQDVPAVPASGTHTEAKPQAGFDQSQTERTPANSMEQELPELEAAPGASIESALQPAELAKQLTSVGTKDAAETELSPAAETNQEGGADDSSPSNTTLARREPVSAWTSAATARQFLEELAAAKSPTALSRFWNARRGDIYLAIAVIMVACVIRWGIWSDHAVNATAGPASAATHHKPAPDAELPLFDRILVKLGLAEAPEPPEYKGNPQTQVWVDLHTALYYCPGTDLYGKTPKGKYTTQRDAQLDQFEPAYQKACD